MLLLNTRQNEQNTNKSEEGWVKWMEMRVLPQARVGREDDDGEEEEEGDQVF